MQYQVLDWDSDLFGVKVARITRPYLSIAEISDILLELKGRQVRLVYWFSEHRCDDAAVKKLCGNLVDRKITFVIDFSTVDLDEILSANVVKPFTNSMPVSVFEDLAIQSGKYSRFAVDQKFPKERFVALYKTWILRSLRKEIAKEVLVIQKGTQIAGMVTLGEKDGRGDIGLIAVKSGFRRKKYGETLVRAAQRWFIKSGFEYGQVVTQGQNIPACNLYTKCGYSIERTEYCYHFWL